YIELIPVLIKGIQEQDQKMQQIVNLQQQINDLKLQILELKQMIQKQSGAQPSDAGTGYLLKQNTPNPVGNNTNISYTIPAGSVRTELILTNSLGQTIQTIAITGSGLLNIDTSTLTNGVYFYSLVADGKTMITKKLVVSK
ncbi:MAG TPA: T9SS type A sorting domain-containing protein, partial [Flavisolibacter sp.]|nr:T9SS type A sorting domain-containing protein [Flavisolibacter sp.]